MGRMKKAKWKSREEHNDYIHAECSGCGFQVRVMMPLKQEDPVQNISKQNGSSARSAELK